MLPLTPDYWEDLASDEKTWLNWRRSVFFDQLGAMLAELQADIETRFPGKTLATNGIVLDLMLKPALPGG